MTTLIEILVIALILGFFFGIFAVIGYYIAGKKEVPTFNGGNGGYVSNGGGGHVQREDTIREEADGPSTKDSPTRESLD